MELHVNLPTDRTNRRRLQNRIAQRKFRSTRAQDQSRPDSIPVSDATDVAPTNATPTAAAPLEELHKLRQIHQLQQIQQLQTANDNPDQYHCAPGPIMTAFCEPDGSRSASLPLTDLDAAASHIKNTPALSDFGFGDGDMPGTGPAMDAHSQYERPADLETLRTLLQSSGEVDYFLDLDRYPARTAQGAGVARAQPSLSAEVQRYPTGLGSPGRSFPPRAQTRPSLPAVAYNGQGGTAVRGSPNEEAQTSTLSGSAPSSSLSATSTPATSSSGSTNSTPPFERGYLPNYDRGWLSALHIAARRGHERIVGALLARSIDFDQTDSDGRTALLHACIDGHEAVVRTLLAKGARISQLDRRRRSALHWAVVGGHKAILALLLEHYLRRGWEDCLDAYDEVGWTALHLAVERNFEPAVLMLIEAGADLHARARKTCNGDRDEGDAC